MGVACSVGFPTVKANCERRMRELGYNSSRLGVEGMAPHAVGNRIAKLVLTHFYNDGASHCLFAASFARASVVLRSIFESVGVLIFTAALSA